MKIIIFVHTCEKYEESRAKLIEQTWGDQENVVFITDNPHSTLKRHTYLGPYPSGPTYHPTTVVKMFELFITNYSQYDFFMIIDDDSYLYINKLITWLSVFDPKEPYMIGDFLNWVAPREEPHFTCDYNRWVSGGPGIVFTKKCIETFLKLVPIVGAPFVNHDVWLHFLFMNSDKRIKRVDCPGFHQYKAKELIERWGANSPHLISIHLERDMELIWQFHSTSDL